jgi:Ubiquitin-activating enzyme E1 FCCH domain
MAKARLLKTNFTAGELSPRMEGRPDLAKYFNGASTLENYLVFPQGGAYRAPGSRWVKEVKDSTKKTRLVPFVVNRTTAYVCEFGQQYIRFYKNGAPITQTPQAITSITQANPAVVTYSGADTFANGDRVIVTGVAGMTQVNNREFTVAGVNTGANTFQLSGVDSSGYDAYVSGGAVAEIVELGGTPYLEADLFQIQYVQSVDVLFLDHPLYQTRKLARASDTSWSLTTLALRPPPSFEDLTDISEGNVQLDRGADTGTGINFTANISGASSAKFLAGDVGRNIIAGASRAVITALGGASPNAVAVCDILDTFAGQPAHIPSGSWFLNLSPQSAIDTVSKSKPVGTQVTVNFKNNVGGAAQDTLRTGSPSPEIGKFIKVLGGEIEITAVGSRTQCTGIIRTTLSKADKTKNPTGVEAGDWTLNVKSWDATPTSLLPNGHGFPSAITFFQGRLYHGGSGIAQPTTFWGSASDDYENYGVGSLADDAVEYTIASRQFNKIQWLVELGPLAIGTLGSVFSAKGPGVDNPLGGDVVPFIRASNAPGAASAQPVLIGSRAIYIDASGMQAIELGYDFNDDNFVGTDLTLIAEHIAGGGGFAQQAVSYARNPNSILYFLRSDGQLACLTYYRVPENVVAWSRRKTDGAYESCCAIPHPDGTRDQVWTIVNRTVAGATKRYVEYFEDNAAEFVVTAAWSSAATYAANDQVLFNGAPYFSLQAGNTNHQPDTSPAWWQRARSWTDLHTDCAFVYSGAAATNVTGLSFLEGKTVDVVADGAYKGTRIISGGTFNNDLETAAARIEIGLHYDSQLTTMRPALQESMIEGTQKIWDKITLRLLKSIGGSIKTPNGGEELIPMNIGGQPMDIASMPFTGDKPVPLNGIDDTGRITVFQKQPYPQTILAVYGRLNISNTD